MFDNAFTGPIPESLGNLSNLTSLTLDLNELSGPIPSSLGNLTNLTTLWLDSNNISGTLPSSLGNLTNLTSLSVGNSEVSGSIPSSLGSLTNLTKIYLDNASLSGSIPSSLGNLTNLTRFETWNNSLTGCVPANLRSFVNAGTVSDDNKRINPQSGGDLAVCDGIVLSKAQLSVAEESTATYTVRLSTAPTANVTVTLTKVGDGDITFDTNTATTGNQATLMFTAANYATVQTVTLSAADDVDNADGTATITNTATSTDSTYNNLTSTVTATESDNETRLSASGISRTGATLTLTGHAGNWWLKRTSPADTTCKAKMTTYTESLTDLSAGSSYTYKGYSNSGCTTEIGSATFTTLPAPNLAASSVTDVSATLTLTNYSGNWWLKRTAPSAGVCKSKSSVYTESLMGLTASRSYTYKAYSDAGCSSEVASETFTTLTSTLTASSVTLNSATLTLTNYSGNWWLKRTAPSAGVCKSKSSVYTESLMGLTASRSYTYKGYSDSGCTTEVASETFMTSAAPALTASSVTLNSATLTLTNYSGNWWLKRTAPSAGVCDSKSSVYTESLMGLTASRLYTYKAYSDAGCSSEVASETFTTLTPALTASSVTLNSATLTLTNYVGNWWLKRTAPDAGTCDSKSSVYTESLMGLTASRSYTYKGYSDSGCTTEVASETFMTSAAPALTASSVTHNGATLTLANYVGNWWLKRTAPSAGVCKSKSSVYTESLMELTALQSYTYKAYSDAGCSSEVASETFTTSAPPALTASSVTHNSATLTLANYVGNWWLKRTAPSAGACDSKSSVYTESLMGLTASRSYTYKGYSDSGCTTEVASETFMTSAAPALTASSFTHDGATLTLTNYVGNWWLKRTTPSADVCKSKSSVYTETLTGLDATRNYTYAAYSDNRCSSLLISVTFTTLTGPSLTASSVTHNSATLTLTDYVGNWWLEAD